MKIYAVTASDGGHEPLAVLSFWLTNSEAQTERRRYRKANPNCRDIIEVKEWPVAVKSDEHLN